MPQDVGTTYYTLKGSVSTDGGAHWADPKQLADSTESVVGPSVVASHDLSRIAVAWSQSPTSASQVKVVTTSNAGQDWSPAKTLSDTGVDSNMGDMIASQDGRRITVSFLALKNYKHVLQTSSSANGGADWGRRSAFPTKLLTPRGPRWRRPQTAPRWPSSGCEVRRLCIP